MSKLPYNYTEQWLDDLQSAGRYSFSLEEALEHFSVSKKALKSSLYRLSKKEKIASVVKGFYVIVPPEYRKNGILPPVFFIDSLMQFVKHEYYVCLSTAAAYYGAAHQVSQTFFVMTELPTLRPIQKKGLHIQFIHSRDFSKTGVQKLKSKTGYFAISTPELTALDLIKFEKSAGRLQRSVEILSELQEEIKVSKLEQVLENTSNTAIIQRFGYICDNILESEVLAEAALKALKQRSFRYTKLVNGINNLAFKQTSKWKVNINYELTTEL